MQAGGVFAWQLLNSPIVIQNNKMKAAGGIDTQADNGPEMLDITSAD
jgi:hypothetical protein